MIVIMNRLAFKKEDGFYHLPVAQSPEYGNSEDTVYDLSLFRWGVKTADEVLSILKIEDPNQSKWHDIIDHFVRYPQDNDGLMVGATLKLTSMHRHWSHLFPIYPLHEMDHEITPELDLLIQKSLDHWTSYNPTDNGFSIAASAIMNEMIPGRDEKAWTELEKAWSLNNLGRATFYWESSHCPVNESPFGLIAALQYMILRSDTRNINVFPQRIEALRNVSFYHLKAEGGFLVSGVLKDLKTE